jgi:hypothetical protein
MKKKEHVLEKSPVYSVIQLDAYFNPGKRNLPVEV